MRETCPYEFMRTWQHRHLLSLASMDGTTHFAYCASTGRHEGVDILSRVMRPRGRGDTIAAGHAHDVSCTGLAPPPVPGMRLDPLRFNSRRSGSGPQRRFRPQPGPLGPTREKCHASRRSHQAHVWYRRHRGGCRHRAELRPRPQHGPKSVSARRGLGEAADGPRQRLHHRAQCRPRWQEHVDLRPLRR